MAWDWTFVEQLAVGIALGIALGSYMGAFWFRAAVLEIVAHPTVRKFANAADRVTSKGEGGGWWGILGKLADRFLGTGAPAPPRAPPEGSIVLDPAQFEPVLLADGRHALAEKKA